MATELEIVINKDGTLEVEIKGQGLGTKCTTITSALTSAHEEIDSRLTEDYFEVNERPAWIVDDG